jgi:hypothetical protein
MTRFSSSTPRSGGSSYVGVPSPTLVYVGVPVREDFDRIKGDATPIAGGVAKSLQSTDGVTIIFQYWEGA